MDCAVGANVGWMDRVLLVGFAEYIADGTGIKVDVDGRGLNVTDESDQNKQGEINILFTVGDL